MVQITTKKLSGDTIITSKNDTIVPSFKDRLYSLCNDILPKTNYWDSTTSVPDAIDTKYLCSRNELLSDIANIIDNDTTVDTNEIPEANATYELIKKVFIWLSV